MFPKDINYEIGYHLDFKTLFEYSLTNKKLFKLWNDYGFWYNYLLKNYRIKYDPFSKKRRDKGKSYIKQYIYWLDKIREKYGICYYKLPKTVNGLGEKYRNFSEANYYAYMGNLDKLKEMKIKNYNLVSYYAAKGTLISSKHNRNS